MEKKEGVSTGSIDAVYREEESTGTMTLSRPEAELLRRQITELDMKLAKVSWVNKVLKIVLLTLLALTLLPLYLHFSPEVFYTPTLRA